MTTTLLAIINIPIAIAVVATATVGVWRATARSDAHPIIVGGVFVLCLLVGGLLQLMSPLGVLLGVIGGLIATGYQLERLESSAYQRPPASIDAAAERLAIVDRIDEISNSETPLRQLVTGVCLGILLVVGVSLIAWGIESSSRLGLFLGPLALSLPSIWCAAAWLAAAETRHLSARLAELELGTE